jgi:hypothetical protein
MSSKTWTVLAFFVLPLTVSCVGDPPIPGTGPVKVDGGPSPIVDALAPDAALVDAGTCYPLPIDALAWWKGDSNAANALSLPTSRKNDLTWESTGGANYARASVGQGFFLDGNSQSSLTVNGSDQVDTAAAFSVEAWIRFDTVKSPRDMIVMSRRSDPGVANGWSLKRGFNQKLSFDMDEQSAEGSVALSDAVPTHIAMTFDTTTVAFHINGMLDVARSGVTAKPKSRDLIKVGAAADSSSGSNLRGIIDELTLYGRVLTAAEIAAIYQAGPAGKCPPQR